MRLPRLSIAGLMTLVALSAFDCLAWMGGDPGYFHQHAAVVVLRTLLLMPFNLLVLAAILRAGRRREGRPSPFFDGFLVAGGLALVATSSGLVDLFRDLFDRDEAFGFVTFDPPEYVVVPIVVGIFAGLGALGGLANRLYRAALERRRERPGPRAGDRWWRGAIAVALAGVAAALVGSLVAYRDSFSPNADELARPETAPIALAIRGLGCGAAGWILVGMWRSLGAVGDTPGGA